jgi:hypothetical protein
MPVIQEFWKKLNANERLVGWGAVIVLAAWLVGIVTGGGIGASWSFLAAIGVLVVYWLKYSPTSKVNWPAPVQTIVLVAAGLAAVFSLLGLLTVLSFLGALSFFGGFFIGYVIAIIANAIGSVMMALGAWREYQAMPKAAPPAPPAPPAAPPPTAPPPTAPPPPAT